MNIMLLTTWLKPVSFDRFLKSVHKARVQKEQKDSRNEDSKTPRHVQMDQTIYLKSSGKFLPVKSGGYSLRF